MNLLVEYVIKVVGVRRLLALGGVVAVLVLLTILSWGRRERRRGGSGRESRRRNEREGRVLVGQTSTREQGATTLRQRRAQTRGAGAGAGAGAGLSDSAPSAIIRRKLMGARIVSISVDDILLMKAPTLPLVYHIDETNASVVRSVAAETDLYIISRCQSDEEEEARRAVLEAANLGPPPYKLLFCSTEIGKTAMVRQLEPGIHFESEEKVAAELSRFLSKIFLVKGEGKEESGKARKQGKESHIESIAAYFA